MAKQKGKSFEIRQAIHNLEEALSDWNAIEAEPKQEGLSESEEPKKDPRRQRTLDLLDDLKKQLSDFDKF